VKPLLRTAAFYDYGAASTERLVLCEGPLSSDAAWRAQRRMDEWVRPVTRSRQISELERAEARVRDASAVLVAGTPLDLGDAHLRTSRPVVRWESREVAREQRWLHAVVTSILGRDHRRPSGSCARPDWSLVRWPAAPSGWAIAWWSEGDAVRVRCTTHRVRVGPHDAVCRIGPVTRVAWPPRRVDGAYRVRIEAVTPVVAGHVADGADPDAASPASIRASIAAIARRLRVGHGPLAVRVVSDRAARMRVPMPGARAPLRAWTGVVTIDCTADARWLLDIAARGVGLGGRTAYGYGTVRVVDIVATASSLREARA